MGDRRLLIALLGACALALGACGDTLQDRPIAHNELESLLVAPYPVYWLGGSFQHLHITNAEHDPGGAFTVQYGDCVVGGQSTCLTPVRVVTSPDNSFLPGSASANSAVALRGIQAIVAQRGRTIVLGTGGVVVDVYADSPRLAQAAAQTLVPINEVGEPHAPLPASEPPTSFSTTPLPSQTPSPLHALR
ncbi:MAG TPA: hypothetical protein VGI52_06935 [Solirubrobacteraceae bacterium]|jgi:hypothetical protein